MSQEKSIAPMPASEGREDAETIIADDPSPWTLASGIMLMVVVIAAELFVFCCEVAV